MSRHLSSVPPLNREPSSGAPLRVVHESIVSKGPGLAKGRLFSATCVQYGAEFQRLRLALGYSQDAAARLFGVTARTVRGWEHGEHDPPLHVMDWLRTATRKVGT